MSVPGERNGHQRIHRVVAVELERPLVGPNRAGIERQAHFHLTARCHRERPERVDEEELRPANGGDRSEEHTSELQSLRHLVCRLLLEKKKKKKRKKNNKNTHKNRLT